MRIIECGCDVASDALHISERQSLLEDEAVAQRSVGNEWRDVIQLPVGFAGIDEWNDVRMRQSRSDSNLPHETLGAERRRELTLENLDRDLSRVLLLFGEMDDCHTAVSNLPLDCVAVVKRSADSRHGSGHFSWPIMR